MSDEFKKLLESLQTVQKSMETPPPKGKGGGEEEEEEEEEEDEEKMGKALTVTVGGKEIQAVDGTEILKSFGKRQRKLIKSHGIAVGLIQALVGENEKLAKALAEQAETNAALKKALDEQAGKFGEHVKVFEELKKSHDTIASAGRGRKSAVVVVPDSQPDANGVRPSIAPQEFMAKALSAQREGKVTGEEIAIAEAGLLRGMPPNDGFVRRVFEATKVA